jgi:hypothetical protein
MRSLTTKFRNRAAHIDELGQDYRDCRELIGSDGALWKLVVATEGHKWALDSDATGPCPLPQSKKKLL